MLWLLGGGAVILLVLLAMLGLNPVAENKRKCYQKLILTPADEELLRSVSLSQERVERWRQILRRGKRYHTPSGKDRLRLDNRDSADLKLLQHIANKAGRETAEDREIARAHRLQDKLDDLGAMFDAKWHWWVDMSEEDRRESRRMGQSWKSYKH